MRVSPPAVILHNGPEAATRSNCCHDSHRHGTAQRNTTRCPLTSGGSESVKFLWYQISHQRIKQDSSCYGDERLNDTAAETRWAPRICHTKSTSSLCAILYSIWYMIIYLLYSSGSSPSHALHTSSSYCDAAVKHRSAAGDATRLPAAPQCASSNHIYTRWHYSALFDFHRQGLRRAGMLWAADGGRRRLMENRP